jgi:hypothetical protein
MVWRGLALLFAVSVVTIRLGVVGCSPAFIGPTKAGGGFNSQGAPPSPPANKNATPAAKPTAKNAPAPRLSDPAFFAPTKAGGGFYPGPAPAAAPQQQAGPEPTYPGSDRAGRTQQAGEPR